MTIDEGRMPEGEPERSPNAGEGAPSGVEGNWLQRFSVQRKMAIVAHLLRGEPLDLVRQGVRGCFGAIAPGVARGLKLRHDHSSNYMSGDFQDEIKCLGIEASPSFVREPKGNGVAERFIRTLKELWVKTFDTIEQLRTALVELASATRGMDTRRQQRSERSR
jgi:hypothetical protein